MNPALNELLHHPGIWRGFSDKSLSDERTGFRSLDRMLPGHGWPRQSLVELHCSQPGIGELGLLLPSLRERAQCWISPPYIPYAPALAQAGIDLQTLLLIQVQSAEERLWAIQHVLRSGVYSQVLAWHDTQHMTDLRRLQLATEAGGSRLFLFRPAAGAQTPSPANLRLYLEPSLQGLQIHILKCRGGQPGHLMVSHDEFMASVQSAKTGSGRTANRAA